MLQHRHLVLVALFALAGFSACSKDDPSTNASNVETDPSPLSNASSYGNIYFDSALTPKERGAFVTAMAYGDQTHLTMREITGSDESAHQWLEDRVQYIVNNIDYAKFEKTDLRGFQYPNPGVYGSPDGQAETSEEGPKVIMQNIGATFYTRGKQGNFLWQILGDGMGEKPITSPRTGILMVGEGLFMDPAKYTNYIKIFHLGTLLHEARHSDGNGKTAGFFHANCTSDDPDQAPYKGKPACDRSTNGPYTVGALATLTLMNSCSECSEVEKNALYQRYLDFKSRVIYDSHTQAWDDTPEGQR